MKRLPVFVICLLLACNALPLPIAAPDGLTRIIGGISDTRPFFGDLKSAIDDSRQGAFLLATCGCGDWRMLLQMSDGTQYQFPVAFYTSGDYVPMGDVTVYGDDGTNSASGILNQDDGSVAGAINVANARRRYAAQRADSHTLDEQACILCHLGDDPIFPRPATHPPVFSGCLNCHTLNIK